MLMFSIVALFVFPVLMAYAASSDLLTMRIANWLVGAMVVAYFALALLAGGAANAWAGRELRRNNPRGRVAVLWLGALNLFILPFGTALGIYAFWVLLHNRTRAAFVARN
jgi:Flp pilus assembly protein protease CpaA